MIVALYVRVSDETKQGKGFSLQEQLNHMQTYCAQQSWETISFVEMESASMYGKGINRTELGKIMELARTRQIDAIMYYKADRFTRDLADGILLRRELYQLGIRLFCYYPSPREITNDLEILNVFEDYGSQQFVMSMRENSMRGYRGKAKRGLYPAGTPPYGYKIEGKKDETKIVLDLEYSKVVEIIYDWYVYHMVSTGEIARRLTGMHILSPGDLFGKVKKLHRGEWSSSTVLHVLRNEAYKGVWRALRYDHQKKKRDISDTIIVPIPPIIDEDTWNKAQLVNRKRPKSRSYLLSGIAICSKGHSVIGNYKKNKNGTERKYYMCQGGSLIHGESCDGTFRCDRVDPLVWQYVVSLINDPTALDTVFHQLTNGEYSILEQQINLLSAEIVEREEKIQELISMRLSAKIDAIKKSIDTQIETEGDIVTQIIAKKGELERALQGREQVIEYRQTLETFIEAIKGEVDDITATNDRVAMRQIIDMFQLSFVFHYDSNPRCVDIIYSGNTDVRVSINNISTLLLNRLTRLNYYMD